MKVYQKFYNNYIYPIDCTSVAQLITTLINFGDNQIAFNIAKWMILNMQKDDGSFKFRRYKYYNINTSFMRWSNAWMFQAPTLLKSMNEYSILPYSPAHFHLLKI